MTITNRSDLITALRQADADGERYWNAFTQDDFFANIGDAWSPADNVRHLTKAIRPVAKALTIPKLVLLLRFGRSRRTSVTFDQLRERYQGLLAAGGKAGRFAPSAHAEPDAAAWRTSIMQQRRIVQDQLIAAIERWSESQLDRHQLPHPLLGKLTVREMLFFTLYHQSHHVAVVERRRSSPS
jgi:hypothetical protein